jgi:membrane protein DedA with SNARE-associated domain
VVIVSLRGTRNGYSPADASSVFELLALVLGAAVGAVATYLGGRSNGGDKP